MRAVRGDQIAMIFQEPMTSLNPVLTIGVQVAEPVQLHRGTGWTRGAASARANCSGASRIPDAGEPRSPPTPTSSPAACASA